MFEDGRAAPLYEREIYERMLRVELLLDEINRTVKRIEEKNLEEFRKRVRSLELRVYGLLAGLVAAFVGLVRLGVI